jgi:putative membrane protein
MVRFIVRWAINAVAIYAAVQIVNNVFPNSILLQRDTVASYVWMGLIFGLVNALLRPLISFLTCPLIILTLGLFTLIINTIMFYLVGWIGAFFGVGYTVSSFLAALLGAIVVSLVSVALSLIIPHNPRRGY